MYVGSKIVCKRHEWARILFSLISLSNSLLGDCQCYSQGFETLLFEALCRSFKHIRNIEMFPANH